MHRAQPEIKETIGRIHSLYLNLSLLQLYIESGNLTFYRENYTFAPMGKGKQIYLHSSLKSRPSQHGGAYKNPQKRKRPLGLRNSTHLVLKSTKATGSWSLTRHKKVVEKILTRFARKHHIGLLHWANVGNHLHLNIKAPTRQQYQRFIRAISSAIATAVTGYSRWKKAPEGFKFWDTRPFSRIISSWTEAKTINRYITKNQFEGLGYSKDMAIALAKQGWSPPKDSS